MEELTLRQMQEGALNILKKLDGICREQGLRYFLFYGTLIGAIRHKGFIPWDDDLDVAMPRPDFDKLVAYCRRHRQELQPMQLMTVDDNPRYVYPIARFSDTRYRVKYQGIRDYGLGLFVDIYPLDGCGDTEEEARAWVQQPHAGCEVHQLLRRRPVHPQPPGLASHPRQAGGLCLGPAPRKRPLHPPHRGLGPAEGL